MNTKQLQYFLQVYECGSIASAARKLDIAQPALSLQISKLEHELHTTLFTRGHKGVRPTEAGNLFSAHANAVINQLNKALNDIKELEGSPSGTIVIAMNQATDNILALPLCKAIESRFPEIDLDLRTGLSYEVIDLLKRGIADIAIIYDDELDTPDISRELLIKEAMYFISSPDKQKMEDTIRFKELSKHEVVVTSGKESLAHTIHEHEQITGIELKKRRPYGQLMTSLRFACEGHCNLILPSSAFYHLEQTQQLIAQRIVDPEIYRNVYIATDLKRPIRNITLKIIELVKQCTADEYRQNKWRGSLNPEYKPDKTT